MGLFGKKEVLIPSEYEQFNKFSEDKERLLCVGSSTTECKHKVEAKVVGGNRHLKLYYPKNRGEKVKKYWLPMFNIYDEHSAMSLFASWIENNDYTTSISEAHSRGVKKEIRKAAQKFGYDDTALLEAADKITTCGAFDLERLGYIVRVCYSLELISEQQAWTCFEILREEAELNFANWDDYIVSFLNGQEGLGTNWYSDTHISYIELRQDSQSFINRYPLA
ncbi:DUF1266 domain-containing protein [Listeria fleischmannii]|uniref:DUF1266 domain-containing protein n=1 Tax=Listeria fleischmannii TaxID=1069827 RepID=A0A841YG63_9LIST|nr:DUF1266 domain-containing protein [Listeria fleischmannii]EIA20599.1 hypothetical protein KKC_06107 [Listeria fleischmannii subsp. coloradonensis]MBC1399154.1 DUF1266 domain-containing protein [Listeria fleischmannii]MBC1427482.1 DUF1266 domain-containing protein [Listeria fleischmannii]STY36185.1 Uncharacterised protein [Listeria fleischmannii subsp. coloradonensis]